MKRASPFELLLLAVLLVAIIVYGGIRYLVTPLKTEASGLSAQITSEKNELRAAIGSFAGSENKRLQLEELKKATEPYAESFFSGATEDEYLTHIRECLADCKLAFTSLEASDGGFTNVSGVSADTLVSVLRNDPTAAGLPIMQDPSTLYEWINSARGRGGRFETGVTATTIQVEASGRYNDILTGLQKLLNSSGCVTCSDMTVDLAENVSLKAEQNPEVRMVLTLVFADIPAMRPVTVPDPVPVYPMPPALVN